MEDLKKRVKLSLVEAIEALEIYIEEGTEDPQLLNSCINGLLILTDKFVELEENRVVNTFSNLAKF